MGARSGRRLLLSLFVLCLRFAPFAVFLQFDLALDKLFVLAGPIVYVRTFGAREFYELILGHERRLYPKKLQWSTAVICHIYGQKLPRPFEFVRAVKSVFTISHAARIITRPITTFQRIFFASSMLVVLPVE